MVSKKKHELQKGKALGKVKSLTILKGNTTAVGTITGNVK
jgi:hypothetical protein